MAEPEINQYAANVNSSISFDFVVIHADNSPDALDKIMELDAMGVRYIIGSNCVACVAYGYVEYNDMVLVSSRSKQPLFSMEDEHMFRVCPTDKHQGQVISKMLESKGKENIAILRRGDSWADSAKFPGCLLRRRGCAGSRLCCTRVFPLPRRGGRGGKRACGPLARRLA